MNVHDIFEWITVRQGTISYIFGLIRIRDLQDLGRVCGRVHLCHGRSVKFWEWSKFSASGILHRFRIRDRFSLFNIAR